MKHVKPQNDALSRLVAASRDMPPSDPAETEALQSRVAEKIDKLCFGTFRLPSAFQTIRVPSWFLGPDGVSELSRLHRLGIDGSKIASVGLGSSDRLISRIFGYNLDLLPMEKDPNSGKRMYEVIDRNLRGR